MGPTGRILLTFFLLALTVTGYLLMRGSKGPKKTKSGDGLRGLRGDTSYYGRNSRKGRMNSQLKNQGWSRFDEDKYNKGLRLGGKYDPPKLNMGMQNKVNAWNQKGNEEKGKLNVERGFGSEKTGKLDVYPWKQMTGKYSTVSSKMTTKKEGNSRMKMTTKQPEKMDLKTWQKMSEADKAKYMIEKTKKDHMNMRTTSSPEESAKEKSKKAKEGQPGNIDLKTWQKLSMVEKEKYMVEKAKNENMIMKTPVMTVKKDQPGQPGKIDLKTWQNLSTEEKDRYIAMMKKGTMNINNVSPFGGKPKKGFTEQKTKLTMENMKKNNQGQSNIGYPQRMGGLTQIGNYREQMLQMASQIKKANDKKLQRDGNGMLMSQYKPSPNHQISPGFGGGGYGPQAQIKPQTMMQTQGQANLARSQTADKEKINIVFATDGNQLPVLPTVIRSIWANTHRAVQIYIVYVVKQWSPYPASAFSCFLEDFHSRNITLIQINATHYIDREVIAHMNRRKEPRHFSTEANYIRPYLHRILPRSVNRFIYLDTDVIVVDDIGKLWDGAKQNKGIITGSFTDKIYYTDKITDRYGNFDIKNPLTTGEWAQNRLGLQVDKSFRGINIGVYVMNVTKLRTKEEAIMRALRMWAIGDTKYRWFPDDSQQIMVYAFYGELSGIDSRWNIGVKHANRISSGRDLGIIHYNGPTKPWNGGKAFSKIWMGYEVKECSGHGKCRPQQFKKRKHYCQCEKGYSGYLCFAKFL